MKRAPRSLITGLIAAIALTVAACSAQTSTETQTAAVEDTGAMTEQESEAVDRAEKRTDLEVQATTIASGDSTFGIHAQIRALDRTFYLDPTLIIESSNNVVVATPAEVQCEPNPVGTTCLLANFADKANSAEWTELEFTATITGPGPHEVTIIGESRGNIRGENDPDQTNNTVVLDLTPS